MFRLSVYQTAQYSIAFEINLVREFGITYFADQLVLIPVQTEQDMLQLEQHQRSSTLGNVLFLSQIYIFLKFNDPQQILRCVADCPSFKIKNVQGWNKKDLLQSIYWKLRGMSTYAPGSFI